jgi:hypothetical protein
MNHRALVVAAALVATFPTLSRTCQCITPAPGQAIGGARLIFAVHVTGGRGREGRFPVRVLAVWRGELPESTTVTSGVCGFPLEANKDFLVYIHSASDSVRLDVHLCSGTRPLESAYLDRYLLGQPAVRYDNTYETVTLDTVLERLSEPGAEWILPQFGYFRIEAPLLLPRLRRMARAEMPGNQLAAIRAIDVLGNVASDAYPDLCVQFEFLNKQDPTLRAAALSAMLSVNHDYRQNRAFLLKAMDDAAPEVRAVVVTRIHNLQQRDEEEVRKIVWRGLADTDPKIRADAIRGCSYSDFSDAMVKKIKQVSRSEPDQDVLNAAWEYLDAREKDSHRNRP